MGQQAQEPGHEARALLLVAPVERQREQHPETVGVAVERDMVDVRDGDPLVPEDLVDLDRIAELRAQVLEVGGAHLVDRGALRRHLVRPALEQHEERLAQDRGVHVVELRGDHVAPGRGVRLALEQQVGQQHLGEDGRGLGQRQRRLEGQHGMPAGQQRMEGVAELVRERGDLARLARVVDQHPGVALRRDAVAERPAPLAGPDPAVDVPRLEDAPGKGRRLARKAREPLHDRLHGLVVRNPALGFPAHRRVEVEAPEPVHAEPPRLAR